MVSSNMQFLLSMCFLMLAIYLRAELRAQRRERLKQEIRQNQSAFQNEYNARLQEMQTRLNAYEQKQPWNSEAYTPTIAL
jgi:sensor domain CHASE-containing protein